MQAGAINIVDLWRFELELWWRPLLFDREVFDLVIHHISSFESQACF